MPRGVAGMTSPGFEFWRATFASYGWQTCPLAFDAHEELVRDDPVATSAAAAPVTRSMSVGVPHPQYGIMRATAVPIPAASLTLLAGLAHQVASMEYRAGEDLPTLYVGDRPFKDTVDGRECVVLGVLVFCTRAQEVQYAPLTAVNYNGSWLPFFQDVNGWVMTGWDGSGRVTEIFKPFGWGCTPVAVAGASSQASHVPRDDTSEHVT